MTASGSVGEVGAQRHTTEPGIEPEQTIETGEGWITIHAEQAFYVDEGREKVLCDRLPRPVTLVLKVNGRTA